MNTRFTDHFTKDSNILIGAIHFPPLLGYSEFPGMATALDNALADLSAFEMGGFDAVIIENNYDLPHTELVDASVVASLTYLAEKVKEKSKVPLGISVLWNDFKTALSISKIVGLDFIRIPVFVDTVKTSYGIIEGKSSEAIKFRKLIGAENVLLFTDIHVKHSEILSPYSIEESAKIATQAGSDALIITGKWTGDMPDMSELRSVRTAIGEFPILCGSGVNEENVKTLFEVANGAIVSTSVKAESENTHDVNVKSYSVRIDVAKATSLVAAAD